MPVLLTFQLQRLKTCNRQVSCLIITCSFVVSMSLIQWLLWAQPIIFALHLFRLFYVTKTQKWKKNIYFTPISNQLFNHNSRNHNIKIFV